MEQHNSVPSVTTTTTAEPSMAVDPFLVEALQNPRHRLTILRMELDIQKFIQNFEQLQFEFQHFPTSYLRLAAHRVAQHYGLQTMVLDNFSDGQGTRILVRKVAESKYPAVCLSDVPAKLSENEKHEHVKIVLKPRPKSSSDGTNEQGTKSNSIRSVEERKEEYDKARARIFSSPSSPQSDGTPLRTSSDGKNLCFSGDEYEGFRNSTIDLERNFSRDGNTSRVAILRDREKDLTDPDYDRSYERYVRNLPVSQGFNLLPLSLPKFQPPCVQYDPLVPHLGQVPATQASLGYRNSTMNPYPVVGLNHISRDAVYMQWPSHSMMYAHSYDQFRHAVFQAPFCQQPLSFDYSQNH
ncbi:R3H domain-containing protein 2 isoform X2 [Cynara cardunculus var. scolymus]|uniref:R3H domain-containing protein 2 isoform X2 n=1 Tax=Cynara cardunculus var. scolymus TaxID=59895 RepID=UPI000D62DDFE|nr:R3H domain-containing protein 2 isoform X2 [Cynara cardunculus var. scolymus]